MVIVLGGLASWGHLIKWDPIVNLLLQLLYFIICLIIIQFLAMADILHISGKTNRKFKFSFRAI